VSRAPRREEAGSGDVRLTITTDTSGAVTQAELVSSSGDEMLDGLFGTVAAQLKVDSLRATKSRLRRATFAWDTLCAERLDRDARVLHS
jgi:hypothetical protein